MPRLKVISLFMWNQDLFIKKKDKNEVQEIAVSIWKIYFGSSI